jgi:hypothetical protein
VVALLNLIKKNFEYRSAVPILGGCKLAAHALS